MGAHIDTKPGELPLLILRRGALTGALTGELQATEGFTPFGFAGGRVFQWSLCN